MSDELTPDIVRLAYRLFLGREPEDDSVVEAALGYRTLAALRAAFLGSAEFRAAFPHPPALVPIDAPPLDVEWTTDPAALATLLAHIARTWTRLGHERPHWSVLSADAFAPENIAAHEAAFFASGAGDVAALLAILRRHDTAPADLAEIVEYGCGIGRVTPHLARAFARVVACDVSPSHLAAARAVVEGAGLRNVAFRPVEGGQFGMARPFHLWFSRIVLQHNPPPVIALILARALRLLHPGGFAVFQVPTYALGYRFRLAAYVRDMAAREGGIEMHILPQPIVFALAAQAGCDVLEVLEDLSAGPSAAWISNTFVLRKRNEAGG